MKCKKGNIQLYFFLGIILIISITILSIFLPSMALFSTELFKAQENMINQSQNSIDSISDPTIKENIKESLSISKNTTKDNIITYSFLYKYSGIIIVFLVFLAIFFANRNITESKGGGFQ